jgi:peptidoglycan/LPS O-acetylase OafA/YrhL
VRSGSTLGERLDAGPNGIGMLRLILALAVLVSHAWVLGGFGPEPLVGLGRNEDTLGTIAVAGFFVLSGILISRSWVRRPRPAAYLRHRVLRIFPGFWVCLAVIALVIAPLCWLSLHGTGRGFPILGRNSALGYIADNFPLFISQSGIRGTQIGVPFSVVPAGLLNGSLWTLFYEFLCYLGVLALGMLGLLARERRALIAAFTVASLLLLAYVVERHSVVNLTQSLEVSDLTVRVVVAFALGVTMFQFSDVIPMTRTWFLVALGLCIASIYAGWLDYGGLIAFAYVVVWVGLELPIRDLERRGDLSYGIYLYAFPVQQLLAVRAGYRWGVAVYILLTLVLVVPLAVGSWFLVERPALRWKSPRHRDATVANLTIATVAGDDQLIPGPEV